MKMSHDMMRQAKKLHWPEANLSGQLTNGTNIMLQAHSAFISPTCPWRKVGRCSRTHLAKIPLTVASLPEVYLSFSILTR
jgi:hypothetical protein